MIRANRSIAQMSWIRGFAGLIGELLITIGAVLMLFVGWQLLWTDVVSDADAGQVVSTIEQDPTEERYVVHAEPDATYPRAKGVPVDALKVGE